MIEFKEIGKSSSGKTSIFSVKGNEIYLGKVSFFGRWRKYCFYPESNTLFDHLCMNEIADFCKEQTNIIFKRA